MFCIDYEEGECVRLSQDVAKYANNVNLIAMYTKILIKFDSY